MEYRTLRPKKTAKRRRARYAKTILFFGLGATLLFASAYVFFSASSFRIASIKVLGSNVVSEKIVDSLVTDMLVGMYGGLIPRDSQFFYPRSLIETSLESSFADVSRVSTHLTSGGTLSVSIVERIPVGRWCGEKREANLVKTVCRLIDAEGVVFSFAGNRATTTPIYYGRLSSSDTSNPISIVFGGDWKALTTIINFIASRDRSPLTIEVGNDVSVMVKSGAKIVLPGKDIEKSEESLRALFRDVPLLKEHPDLAGIEYIDLRFGNKIFYK